MPLPHVLRLNRVRQISNLRSAPASTRLSSRRPSCRQAKSLRAQSCGSDPPAEGLYPFSDIDKHSRPRLTPNYQFGAFHASRQCPPSSHAFFSRARCCVIRRVRCLVSLIPRPSGVYWGGCSSSHRLRCGPPPRVCPLSTISASIMRVSIRTALRGADGSFFHSLSRLVRMQTAEQNLFHPIKDMVLRGYPISASSGDAVIFYYTTKWESTRLADAAGRVRASRKPN